MCGCILYSGEGRPTYRYLNVSPWWVKTLRCTAYLPVCMEKTCLIMLEDCGLIAFAPFISNHKMDGRLLLHQLSTALHCGMSVKLLHIVANSFSGGTNNPEASYI